MAARSETRILLLTAIVVVRVLVFSFLLKHS